jgi:dihydroorotate dehydrogenase
VFRVAETQSLINRYGFNSEGHTTVMSRLRHRIRQFVARNSLTIPADLFPAPPAYALPDHDVVAQLLASSAGKDALVTDAIALPRSLVPGHVLAINLGKNKTSDPDSISDFVDGVHALGPYADVLVINVSSPNTPGLRNLQRKGMLEELLVGVIAARDSLPGLSNKIPVLVKVAPDLSASELEDIASAVMSAKIDGIVVSNTTISRPASAGESPNLVQAGGLSGPPVKPLALAALSALHAATDGSIPLIGCGGISTGQDAIDFAKAGATLVQLYTSFIYGGVGLPRRIKDEVAEILEKEGKTWTQMVGSGLKKVVRVVEAADNKEVFVPFTPDELVAELKSATHELENVFGDLSPAIPAVVSESPIIDHHHDEPDFCVGSQIEEEGGFCVAPPRKTPAAASTPAPVVESTISPITSDPIDHAKIELLDAAAVNALLAFEPVTPVVVVVVEPVVEAVPSSPQP